MRTHTLSPLFDSPDLTRGKAADWRGGFINRAIQALIKSRQKQADLIIRRHLRHHDDATLAALGWNDAEIARLRGL